MTETDARATSGSGPWTCPFCPLLCDAFGVDSSERSALELRGSDCPRAQAGLARFPATAAPLPPAPQCDGADCSLDSAVAAAARTLAASRQPLFGGLGTDVAGARALYPLACETGAITDPAHGATLMKGLRALQDRGGFTTTLAEIAGRADLIVCLGSVPTDNYPEFFRRCGTLPGASTGNVSGAVPGAASGAVSGALSGGVSAAPPGAMSAPTGAMRVVVVGAGADPQPRRGSDAAAGVRLEWIEPNANLFDAASRLAALVAGPGFVRNAPAGLVALAARLRAARYAVVVYDTAVLPPHGELVVEAIDRIVATLNRTTRAASLPLGGSDGGSTVNQVFTWLSGLPLRSRKGPRGLEHEPLAFDAARLLAAGDVDALLWIASFGGEPLPPAAAVPRVVLGHPSLAARLPEQAGSVFIPVATPGIGAAGHLFRTDSSVLLPLARVYDDGLPTVADVLARLTRAVRALRPVAADAAPAAGAWPASPISSAEVGS